MAIRQYVEQQPSRARLPHSSVAEKKPAVAGLRAAPGGGREEENGAADGTLSVRGAARQGWALSRRCEGAILLPHSSKITQGIALSQGLSDPPSSSIRRQAGHAHLVPRKAGSPLCSAPHFAAPAFRPHPREVSLRWTGKSGERSLWQEQGAPFHPRGASASTSASKSSSPHSSGVAACTPAHSLAMC
jgi:hypothetical protein